MTALALVHRRRAWDCNERDGGYTLTRTSRNQKVHVTLRHALVLVPQGFPEVVENLFAAPFKT